MRRTVLWIAFVSLIGALSCAPRSNVTPAEAASDAAPPIEAALPASPRAAEIEALLSRHLTGLAPHEVRRTALAIVTEAERNRIDPALVLAVMHTESGFYNFARSPVGALGLMQIMPATGEMLARDAGIAWTGPDMLFEPTLNVRFGVRYLALLHARYRNWHGALAAYNWGPGAIDKRLAEGQVLPVQYKDRVYARLARR